MPLGGSRGEMQPFPPAYVLIVPARTRLPCAGITVELVAGGWLLVLAMVTPLYVPQTEAPIAAIATYAVAATAGAVAVLGLAVALLRRSSGAAKLALAAGAWVATAGALVVVFGRRLGAT